MLLQYIYASGCFDSPPGISRWNWNYQYNGQSEATDWRMGKTEREREREREKRSRCTGGASPQNHLFSLAFLFFSSLLPSFSRFLPSFGFPSASFLHFAFFHHRLFNRHQRRDESLPTFRSFFFTNRSFDLGFGKNIQAYKHTNIKTYKMRFEKKCKKLLYTYTYTYTHTWMKVEKYH